MYICKEPGEEHCEGAAEEGGASALGRLNTAVHGAAGGFSRRDTISWNTGELQTRLELLVKPHQLRAPLGTLVSGAAAELGRPMTSIPITADVKPTNF